MSPGKKCRKDHINNIFITLKNSSNTVFNFYTNFVYKGKTYTITYDKSPDGRKWIVFGDIADKQKYDSVGEFLNKAKIENHFFKDMLDIF